MTEPEEHVAHVRGIKLRYVVWGGDGPPLLMLHGDMRTGRSWDAVARDLCPRFRVISLDARGHGDSDWTPTGYSVRDRVDDLAAFCEAIGLRDALGVGHSTGATIVPLYAERFPGTFSRMVLLETGLALDEGFHRRGVRRTSPPRRTWPSRAELYEYLKRHRTAGRWRDDVIRDVVEHETLELPDGSIDMKWSPATFNVEDGPDVRYDLRPIFRDLGLPTLFMTSEENARRFDELRNIVADVPTAQEVTVVGTGHNMYMERPDAVAQAIAAFANGETLLASV